MKLNLKTRNEKKLQLSVKLFESDYNFLKTQADENGISLALLTRSIINDAIDKINKKNKEK